MKITSVEPVALTAPFVPVRDPGGRYQNDVRNCVWLRISTDEGLTGWGEAYCGCYATEVTVASLLRLTRDLVGKNPLDANAVLRDLRFWNRYWAMRGIGAQSTSAVEAALLDIVGQAKGQPIWRLLNDGVPRPVLLYASDGDNRLSPQDVLEEAMAYAAEGYRAYKMRCGGDPYETKLERLALDEERVAAAREGLGPERFLFVDVSVPQRAQTWEPGHAESYMQMLSRYGVRFIEEPAMTYDLARYCDLQALNLVPVAGGESFCCPEEFWPFLEEGGYGVVQPDAAVVGGPTSCFEVCRRAREHGVDICLHTWCAGVGIAQNLHVACSIDGVLAMEGPQMIHAPSTAPLEGIWHFADGYLTPPDRPGLGVQVTDKLLTRYAYRPGNELDY
jgi:L-alanine-DL-glutamate epimerase-like enolase superfamily enzyme